MHTAQTMSFKSAMAMARCNLRPRHSAAIVAKPCRRLRTAIQVVTAELPVATDYPTRKATGNDVRKHLLSIGWEMGWIDGIIGEITKGTVTTNVPQTEAVVSYLKSLGIPNHNVENMVFLCKDILGRSADEVKAVVEHIEGKGLKGETLINFLTSYPKLLAYTPNGDNLEKGKTRATVKSESRNGQEYWGVVFWREGAAFNTAPVSPQKP